MASLCLSHQDASTDMQHDLFWSLRDLDLRSNFDLDLLRSNHISFEASLREKHDDAIADSLSLLVQKLFVFRGQIIYLSKRLYERNTMMPLPILYLY